MINGPDSDVHEPDPRKKGGMPDDLSYLDDAANPLGGAPLGDDEALRKIHKRTTRTGRIVSVAVIVGIAALAGLYFRNQGRVEEQRAKLDAVATMENPEEVKTMLRQLLPETREPDLRWRILMNMGHYKDPEAVSAMMEALDEPGRVRRAAAWAIGQVGLPAAAPAAPKLLQVLPKTDERDRAQVVWTLALLGEKQVADALIDQFSRGLLQHLDGFDPKAITNVLGPERLASNDLLTHPSESVRTLTAHALAETASPAAVDPLARLLRAEMERGKDSQAAEVIRAAAAGLGRTGDPSAARPLFEALQKQPGMKQSILDALRRSTGAPGLAALAKEAQGSPHHRELVRLVAETRDPRGAEFLASQLTANDAEVQRIAAFGLSDLGDARALPVLAAVARGSDVSASDKALDALRWVSTKAGAPTLLALLSEIPRRKALILAALGKTGDQNVASRIMNELNGDDASAAARALAELGYEPGFKKLLADVARPAKTEMGARNANERSFANEDVLRKRKAAIDAMGRYGKPEAADALMKVVEDPLDDYELRALAAQSLGRIATEAQLRTVLQKVQNEALESEARRYYVQALWQKPHVELGEQLIALMANPSVPGEIRRAAALAVGYTADPANDAKIIELLEDREAAPFAAIATLLGGGPEAAKKLVQVLAANRDVRELLQMNVMATEFEWFDLVTKQLVDSGQLFRRIQTSLVLRDGDARSSFSYGWAKTIAVLRGGSDVPGGLNPRQIRERLWEALNGDDLGRRRLAAEAFAAMPERGLLLRARDEGGKGAAEARAMLQSTAKSSN